MKNFVKLCLKAVSRLVLQHDERSFTLGERPFICGECPFSCDQIEIDYPSPPLRTQIMPSADLANDFLGKCTRVLGACSSTMRATAE